MSAWCQGSGARTQVSKGGCDGCGAWSEGGCSGASERGRCRVGFAKLAIGADHPPGQGTSD